SLSDTALRASRRRHPTEDRRLAEGRTSPATRRCHRRDEPRSGRRSARVLASCSQPAHRQSGTSQLHVRPASGVAYAQEDRAMIDLKWALATLVAAIVIAVSSWVERPTKLIWNASASTPI